MEYFLYVAVFVFGAIIGSFLNVVILRYNTGKTIVKGSSSCFSCGKKLHWHELVPIFSFLLQKGKCTKCKSRISWQYPVVETTTGLLFLLIYNSSVSFSEILFGWVIVSLLIVITVYDIRHMIIPNGFVWAFNGLALLYLFISVLPFGLRITSYELQVWNFLSGFAFAGFFALLWAVSRGKWMGFGDAKLALGLGWLSGAWGALSVFLYSFWMGAIVGIFLLFFRGLNLTIKSKIPFAPFLALGFLIYYLTGFSISDLLDLFYF